jgi:hypothetical protein
MGEIRDFAGRPAGVAPRKLEPITKGAPRESFGSTKHHLASASGQDIAALFAERERERYAMHASRSPANRGGRLLNNLDVSFADL